MTSQLLVRDPFDLSFGWSPTISDVIKLRNLQIYPVETFLGLT
jgi:hypothetical protein